MAILKLPGYVGCTVRQTAEIHPEKLFSSGEEWLELTERSLDVGMAISVDSNLVKAQTFL